DPSQATPPQTVPSQTDSGQAVPSQPGGTSPGATQNPPPGGTATNPAINPASLRTLLVGRDIQPGTYRTTGPTTGFPMCYWARMDGASPTAADVIDSGTPAGPATVTIQPTDKAFQTAGCAEWTRA
ncbi:MAG TPA: hypothetical protein VFV66_31085, partial [Nonomuraea sp.]|nr:hypothetical protein [Nonomuraea sp.]